MQIQWYPGHMTKARRMLQDNLKVADVVITLLDARIPVSSWNPDIDNMMQGKQRIVILNKADLADAAITAKWKKYYQAQGIEAIAVTSVKKGEKKQVMQAIERAAKKKVEAMRARGVKKIVRVMVVGIPNVGKSTFINMVAGATSVKAEDRPGVTRGRQWVRIGPYLELMDTPGMLWPKFDDEVTGMHLAFCGSVRDEIVDTDQLCSLLLQKLAEIAPDKLMARYKLEYLEEDGFRVLEAICKSRGFIQKGGVYDTDRAVRTVLDEFRGGKIGQISLESPEE
ncbi:MAG: ribosome biogenesis GTPase YlqF [Clostridia bacterium]|nr:ribosome biogenesis GTPase YlqF [Clostridia bacterium]